MFPLKPCLYEHLSIPASQTPFRKTMKEKKINAHISIRLKIFSVPVLNDYVSQMLKQMFSCFKILIRGPSVVSEDGGTS